MQRILVVLFGVLSYAGFFAAFVYLIGFVGNLGVPKSVDSGPAGPAGWALLVNVLLVALFGLQHSVMARPAFKAWLTRFVPKPAERSLFVLASSAALGLMFWLWRPIPVEVWNLGGTVWAGPLMAFFFFGWFLVLYSSFIIDHFDLFGLRQVYLLARGRPYTHPPFVVRSLYRYVRHPLMAGILIGIWAAPVMTLGHLLFAALMSGYILVGVAFEERDLARHLGTDYDRYRLTTPMLVPRVAWRRSSQVQRGA